jgi:predicted ATPase
MKRYILTGTPGCGKTSILEALKIKGYHVVPEAATDVISFEHAREHHEPWKKEKFIDDIIRLQKLRQLQASEDTTSEIQFYDRSPICTYALAVYLNFQPSENLLQEIERIEKNQIYQKRVFFIENLGFLEPTQARKISFEESLRFEKMHEEAYVKFGYECIKIPAAALPERADTVLRIALSS